jgi:hypothetical protein
MTCTYGDVGIQNINERQPDRACIYIDEIVLIFTRGHKKW